MRLTTDQLIAVGEAAQRDAETLPDNKTPQRREDGPFDKLRPADPGRARQPVGLIALA